MTTTGTSKPTTDAGGQASLLKTLSWAPIVGAEARARWRPPATSLPGATRYYTNVNQIFEDVIVARISTGFHYRSTLVRSNTLGIAVANCVNDNMMTVLPERSVGLGDTDNDGNMSAEGCACGKAAASVGAVWIKSAGDCRRGRIRVTRAIRHSVAHRWTSPSLVDALRWRSEKDL